MRPERPGDEVAIARVNDAAFGQADESRMIEAIRVAQHDRISLVATIGSEVVAHIMFTPVVVESAQVTVMGLAPLAVLPAFQRQGIGSQLVQEGLARCLQSGCQAVVVVGHAEYYPRFGFRSGRSFGLRCEYSVPDDVFMAVELVPGGLAACSGLVRYLPEFGGA